MKRLMFALLARFVTALVGLLLLATNATALDCPPAIDGGQRDAWGGTVAGADRKYWFKFWDDYTDYPNSSCGYDCEIIERDCWIYSVSLYFGHTTNSGVTFTPGTGWTVSSIMYTADSPNCCSAAYIVQVILNSTSARTATINTWLASGGPVLTTYLGQASAGAAEFEGSCTDWNCHYCSWSWTTGLISSPPTGSASEVTWWGYHQAGSAPSGCHPECELEDPKPTSRAWGAIKRLYD